MLGITHLCIRLKNQDVPIYMHGLITICARSYISIRCTDLKCRLKLASKIELPASLG
ncbi:hypothetical protein D3C78_1659450 [compost metagenome]